MLVNAGTVTAVCGSFVKQLRRLSCGSRPMKENRPIRILRMNPPVRYLGVMAGLVRKDRAIAVRAFVKHLPAVLRTCLIS